QHVALGPLQAREAPRLVPFDEGGPLDDAPSAGAARAGGAFVRQPQTLREAGIEQPFARLAFEGEVAGVRLDGYLHGVPRVMGAFSIVPPPLAQNGGCYDG